MLKISTIDTKTERRLVVEGKLVQPWVGELRSTWLGAGEDLGGRKLVVDLSNATVIGAEGENALFELMREGAKFSCCGVLTKYVLKRLAFKCHARANGMGSKQSNECVPKEAHVAAEDKRS